MKFESEYSDMRKIDCWIFPVRGEEVQLGSGSSDNFVCFFANKSHISEYFICFIFENKERTPQSYTFLFIVIFNIFFILCRVKKRSSINQKLAYTRNNKYTRSLDQSSQ